MIMPLTIKPRAKHVMTVVGFILQCTAVLFGAEFPEEAAAAAFAKRQAGVTSVTSSTVDVFAGMGRQAFLVIAIGAKGEEEALQIVGSEAESFVVASRDPALAGLILSVEGGVEYDRKKLASELRVVVKSLQAETRPRSVQVIALKSPSKEDLVVPVGKPAAFDVVVQCVDQDRTVTNHYFYMDTEGGAVHLVKAGSWRVRVIR